MAVVSPAPVSAAVRFGIGVGVAPRAYVAPAPVYRYPGYSAAPAYPPVYPYAYGPSYAYPSVGVGLGFGYGGGYYNRGYYGGRSYYGGHGYSASRLQRRPPPVKRSPSSWVQLIALQGYRNSR